MSKTAWVFPGQGSQKVGMIADLLEQETAKNRLTEAEAILGWSVVELTQDEEKLSQTLYTQPCLYTVETILADALHARDKRPDVVAGHSLGEYVALYTAGVFDFATGLQLVKQRAELMSQVAGGAMMALIGFERAELEGAIAQNPDVVLANDNSDAQAVISGTPEAVAAIEQAVDTKLTVELNVSGAFHSPMMNDAAETFNQILQAAAFADAQIPVLANVDPTPATAAAVLKTRLSQQITGAVRWREIMTQLNTLDVARMVEVGPGNVLTGLLKRAYKSIKRINVASLADGEKA
ncbi:MAG: ACP S-malonyltransferase [Cyanobacteria bacterium P01_G01_bin.54]